MRPPGNPPLNRQKVSIVRVSLHRLLILLGLGVDRSEVFGIDPCAQVHVINPQHFAALGVVAVDEGQSTGIEGVDDEDDRDDPEEA